MFMKMPLVPIVALCLSACETEDSTTDVQNIQLTCEVADEQGLAVRLWFPSPENSRFESTAAVVLRVGGAGTVGFSQRVSPVTLVKQGVGVVEYLSPGTSDGEFSSGGVEGFYADSEVGAIECVLNYLQSTDSPFGEEALVVATGVSIGGNSLLNAVVVSGAPVDGVVLWESPLVDQLILEEPSIGGALDPSYQAGLCSLEAGCPFDHWKTQLAFDPQGGGRLYRDDDGDGNLEMGEPLYDYRETEDQTPVYSREMTAVAEALVFGGSPPDWWLTGDDLDKFWSSRDATGSLLSIRDNGSICPFIYLATGVDHLQLVHDHVILAQEGLAGADFFRLNPDASYVEEAGAKTTVELPAGEYLINPTALSMLPEIDTDAIVLAGELELIDRLYAGRWEADLDGVIADLGD